MKTKRVGAVALLLALVLSLAGCGKSLEKQLPGSWYQKGENEPILSFMMAGPGMLSTDITAPGRL